MLKLKAVKTQAAPYGVFNCEGIDAVTLWDGDGFVSINHPRTIYYPSTGGITVRSNNPWESVKCSDPEAGVVTVFWEDGLVEADWSHVGSVSAAA